MTEHIQPSSSDEISLKDLILKIKGWIAYLKTQWWKIAIAGIVGGIIGFLYALIQPVAYTAKTTFVVEDAKSGPNLGGLASLAGQFGVDLSLGGGVGLISGDNILLYLKSESLAREVLLSPWDSLNRVSLVDVYVTSHKLKERWSKNKKVGDVYFHTLNQKKAYSRLQDSLLNDLIKRRILKSQFSVARIDKKAGFVQISVTMENEKLAKLYCERLIKVAVKRYIDIKTKRQKKTVDILQERADSIANLILEKTLKTASLQTESSTMDINPLFKTNKIVSTEQITRDKTMLSTVYAEVVKNLELAKFTLSQETPVIEIVDQDYLPLKDNKKSLLLYSIICSLIFSLIFSFYQAIKYFLKLF